MFSLIGLIFVLHFAKLDDTTVPIPDRGEVLFNIFWAAGLFGIVSASVGVWQSTKLTPLRRIIMALVFWFEGALVSLLTFNTVANLYLNRIDFPAGKTFIYIQEIPISRAYQTHGKNPSWNIQTLPIWSNMDITKNDYDFMQKHRRPGDNGSDADEISSRGYFCARVHIEQFGDNLRVLHAGDLFPPKGTVIICSQAAKKT